MSRVNGLLRTLRRLVLRRRRPLAAVLTAVAVWSGLQATRPASDHFVDVVVAARDLSGGTTVTPDDVEVVQMDPDLAPTARIDPVGKTLAAPVRAGETVVDLRVLDTALIDDLAARGLVAVPVRIPDAGVVDMLGPGMRIDLIGADLATGTTQVLARSAEVIAIPAAESDQGSTTVTTGGRLVLLGLPTADAAEVSATAVRLYVTVAFSG